MKAVLQALLLLSLLLISAAARAQLAGVGTARPPAAEAARHQPGPAHRALHVVARLLASSSAPAR